MKSEIKQLIDELNGMTGRLTPGQTDFVKGAKYYYGKYKKLSPKQLSILYDIRASVDNNGNK